MSKVSVEASKWVVNRPTTKVPLHLAGKVPRSVQGIKTMVKPYEAPLVNEYALKATAHEQVAATCKREYRKNAVSGAAVEYGQWHSAAARFARML